MTTRLMKCDWSTTRLGDVAAWPRGLRAAASLVLELPAPAVLWWGPDYTALYNDACVPWLGDDRHPGAFGQPGGVGWAGVWEALGPRLARVVATGRGDSVPGLVWAVTHAGAAELLGFSMALSPVTGESGEVLGALGLISGEPSTGGPRHESTDERSLEVDGPGRIVAYDPEAAAILGRPRSNLLGLDVGRPLAAAGDPTLERDLRRAAEQSLKHTEERLREALAAARMIAWDWDLADDRIVCTEAARELFGLESGTVDQFVERIHPDDRPAVRAAIDRALLGVGPLAIEYRLVGPGDRVSWMTTRGTVEFDAGGRAVKLRGVTSDSTERHRAETALRDAVRLQGEALALLDALLAHAPIGFAFFDREHRYVRLNAFLAEINGLPLTAHLGRPIGEVLPWGERSVVPVIDSVFATGEPVLDLEIEGETPAAPGVRRHWLTGFYPVRARDGRFPWVGAIVTEITERKRMEAELRHRADALAEADHRKDEFLAVLAHELRNPIAAISGASRLLGPERTESDRAWARDTISRQTLHAARLIEDLLDVWGISHGRIALRPELTDLEAVIRRAVDAVRPRAEAREQVLTVEVEPGALPLLADPTRIEQVLVNLLGNAVKYTEPRGRIALRAGREGADVVVRVRDNGIGLAPEAVGRLFEPFAQVESSLDRAQGGLGIGLALVRSIVELHGGTVAAASEGLGLGSEFTVRLPLAMPPPPTGTASAVGSPAPATTESVSKRVLIVDDNRDIARVLGRVLTAAGHKVRLADDGPSALDAAREFQPEAVVLDIGLPGLDGYQLAERLRGDPSLRPSLLVAASGYGRDSERTRARLAGFDHHLVKPIDVDDLLRIIARSPREPDAQTPRGSRNQPTRSG